MPEMPHETFVSFMKVVATICIIAMVVSVWPTDGEE
jgi:hypothetical protein